MFSIPIIHNNFPYFDSTWSIFHDLNRTERTGRTEQRKKKNCENERYRKSKHNKRQYVHNTQIHTKNISNTLQINHQQQACGTDKYENAHVLDVTIEFYLLIWRLKVRLYKKVRQTGRQSVVIQLVLCKVACLNISVVCRIKYKCGLQKDCKQIRITN